MGCSSSGSNNGGASAQPVGAFGGNSGVEQAKTSEQQHVPCCRERRCRERVVALSQVSQVSQVRQRYLKNLLDHPQICKTRSGIFLQYRLTALTPCASTIQTTMGTCSCVWGYGILRHVAVHS